jgi:hypothetical protein
MTDGVPPLGAGTIAYSPRGKGREIFLQSTHDILCSTFTPIVPKVPILSQVPPEGVPYPTSLYLALQHSKAIVPHLFMFNCPLCLYHPILLPPPYRRHLSIP